MTLRLCGVARLLAQSHGTFFGAAFLADLSVPIEHALVALTSPARINSEKLAGRPPRLVMHPTDSQDEVIQLLNCIES